MCKCVCVGGGGAFFHSLADSSSSFFLVNWLLGDTGCKNTSSLFSEEDMDKMRWLITAMLCQHFTPHPRTPPHPLEKRRKVCTPNFLVRDLNLPLRCALAPKLPYFRLSAIVMFGICPSYSATGPLRSWVLP